MNNIYEIFQKEIARVVSKIASAAGLDFFPDPSKIVIELIKDESLGDYSSNIAMAECKRFKMPPQKLATLIAGEMKSARSIQNVQVAGPGFINWTAPRGLLDDATRNILLAGPNYGRSDFGQGKRVNIEFVSANPTGPIHAGHARGAIVGDAIASILSAVGYSVTREYYVNDYGRQVDILAQSVYERYLEALGIQKFQPKPGYYPGEYLKPIAKKIAEEDGQKWIDNPDYLPHFKQEAITSILNEIRQDLDDMDVHHDVFTFESDLVEGGAVDGVIKLLTDRGFVYRGVLDKPKGKVVDDWEPTEQMLFKSTDFGDDVDRPLVKSDGKWTYFASDIAYHLDKINRGFDALVDVFGVDHGGYVTRMKSSVKALSPKLPFNILLTQLVKFVEDGHEVKMSKRAGTFITARDVIDTIGKDVLRFVMLTRKSEAELDFDFKKVTEQSAENPVFYVQYASARANSVMRQFESAFGPISSHNLGDSTFSYAEYPEGKSLIKAMLDFPRQLMLAASLMEPHRIAFYLHDLASAFHYLWNSGKCNEKLRFISENDFEKSLAGCAIAKAVSTVISNGLSVLGIKAVKEL